MKTDKKKNPVAVVSSWQKQRTAATTHLVAENQPTHPRFVSEAILDSSEQPSPPPDSAEKQQQRELRGSQSIPWHLPRAPFIKIWTKTKQCYVSLKLAFFGRVGGLPSNFRIGRCISASISVKEVRHHSLRRAVLVCAEFSRRKKTRKEELSLQCLPCESYNAACPQVTVKRSWRRAVLFLVLFLDTIATPLLCLHRER